MSLFLALFYKDEWRYMIVVVVFLIYVFSWGCWACHHFKQASRPRTHHDGIRFCFDDVSFIVIVSYFVLFFFVILVTWVAETQLRNSFHFWHLFYIPRMQRPYNDATVQYNFVFYTFFFFYLSRRQILSGFRNTKNFRIFFSKRGSTSETEFSA